MSVRSKALCILIGLTLLLLLGSIAISHLLHLKGYQRLENENVILDLSRIRAAINERSQKIASTTRDWARWDECYEFCQTESMEFPKKNISESVLENLNVNFIVFTDSADNCIYYFGYDSGTRMQLSLPDSVIHLIINKTTLRTPQRNMTNRHGIIAAGDSILFFASANITKSSGTGDIVGSLIMLRYFSTEVLDQLENSYKAKLSLYTNSHLKLTSSGLLQTEHKIITEIIDKSTIRASGTLQEDNGSIAGIISIDAPRSISRIGRDTSLVIILCFFIICILFSFFSWFLINRLILNPLLKLEKEVSFIDSLSNRVNINARDEIGNLGNMINRMLQSLAHSQESLKQREKDFYELLEKTPAGILLVDSETHKISWANVNSLNVLRADKSDIEGRMLSHLIDPQILASQPDSVTETILRRFDGTQIPIMTSTGFIEYQDKPHRVIAFFNMEKQKLLEDRLSQAYKMEAIGILAGGVAHDLNNILSPLVSYPELALLQIEQGHPLRKAMETIRTSGLKAAAIVQDLLTLARRGVNTTVITNINQVISQFLESPEYEKIRIYHPAVSFKVNLEDDLLNTKGSPFHEGKMIMNLVSNAAEAIKGDGLVELYTANTALTTTLEGYERIPPGEYVVIGVNDTGVGLSKDELSRIFEPFYTKKIMGRSGTGLGMAVVWSTIKDHKGYIDIKSAPGKGTSITLYLPATRESIADVEETVPIEKLRGDGEMVLVVDDVPEQREIATVLLSKLGYAVKTVSSGEAAIDYVKNNRIKVVLIDMIMDPGIDGLETYRRILDFNPKQKAIIVSGFAETIRIKQALDAGAKFYLKKPYTLEQLGKALRSVIAS